MHEYFPSIIDIIDKETGKAFGDLTGPFPIFSLSSNRYIFVLYSYGTNAILADPIRNCMEQESMQAYNVLHEYLQCRGLQPTYVKLDNEVSEEMLRNLENKKVDYQLVPLHMH
eukprot:6182047-Ditylum_brightwellii.AAC.1